MKKLARKLRASADEAAGYEASSFEKHAQFLRDISGLCRRGLLRLAWNSVEKRVEQQTLESLKRRPQVEGFLKMARESSVEQLEDLSRLILQELHDCDPHPLRPESQDSGGFGPRLGRKDLKGRIALGEVLDEVGAMKRSMLKKNHQLHRDQIRGDQDHHPGPQFVKGLVRNRCQCHLQGLHQGLLIGVGHGPRLRLK